jgi:hypothetical protein
MKDYKLPDGTWVTTPVFVGPASAMTCQCADGCDWEDTGPPSVGGSVLAQAQRCRKCGWVRVRYLGNPHPEEDDDAEVHDQGS